MGSAEALSVRCEGGSLVGCSPAQSSLCCDFACRFVSCAAGVIAGTKPMALFSYAAPGTCGGPASAREVVRACVRGASSLGLRVAPVGTMRGRTMLLAWREGLVGKVLSNAAACSLLADAGFDVRDAASLMRSVRARLARYYRLKGQGAGSVAFPHELGVLFGYPVEDVRAFIGGRAPTCRGAWCAYGDPAVARGRFDAVARGERRCRERWRSGVELRELLAEPLATGAA